MVSKKKERAYADFAKRLNEACDDAGLPKDRGRASELGRLTNLTYKAASKWLAGAGMPDMGNASVLAVSLNVSFEWLMTGRPPKTTRGDWLLPAHDEHRAPYSNKLDPIEALIRTMPPLAKRMTWKFIRCLHEIMEESEELFVRSQPERDRYRQWRKQFNELREQDIVGDQSKKK